MAIVKININAIKFEDMTVTFHPIKPSRPVIINTEKGEIAEQGTHDELIAKEGRYYQLYTYQARI